MRAVGPTSRGRLDLANKRDKSSGPASSYYPQHNTLLPGVDTPFHRTTRTSLDGVCTHNAHRSHLTAYLTAPPGVHVHARSLACSLARLLACSLAARPLRGVPHHDDNTQPPSKGSLRGSKCTPLCNSQLPACKPIVCRRSQVSKSYIDAEQRRQRSSISILAVRRRARALSTRSDQ